MENFMTRRRKSSKPQNNTNITMCKKHPKHRQSPGVCSMCLREKLSKLPSMTTSSSRATAAITNASSTSSSLSSLSSLSSQCSSNVSSCSSPTRPMHGLDGKGYLLSFLKSNKIVLTKSRSMAATFVVEEREHGNGVINKKKKGHGFWSKLIRSKTSSKRMVMMGTEGGGRLMHSRTMRDMLSTRA